MSARKPHNQNAGYVTERKSKHPMLSLPPEVRRTRLPYLWEFWARPDQIWRPGPELITLVQAGRGWGKTSYGAQAVRWVAEHPEECGFGRPPLNESAPIIGLVARTAHDAIGTMIYGSSGIMAVSPPWFRPRFKSSEKLLVWPNGMRAHYYTAVLPETLRGPNFGFVWGQDIYNGRAAGLRLALEMLQAHQQGQKGGEA